MIFMKGKEEILNIIRNQIPIWGYSPKGIYDPALSIEISKIGGVGLVDFEGLNLNQCQEILRKIYSSLSKNSIWGIRIPTQEFLDQIEFHEIVPIIVCSFSPNSQNLSKLQEKSNVLVSEVLYLEEAYDTAHWADLFLVKGNEAGGMVGTKNSFILIQEFQKAGLSFIIQGGFGIYNISSALIGGALGVVLESQLYLFPECPLNQRFKDYIKTIEENDFYLVMESSRYNYRLIGKLANKSIRKIKEIEINEFSSLDQGLDGEYQDFKKDFSATKIKINSILHTKGEPPDFGALFSEESICRNWRRGWDSNPRYRF